MYQCAGKVFQTMNEAISYANFLAKVSRIVVAVEKVKA
jgi:hypothetical protein